MRRTGRRCRRIVAARIVGGPLAPAIQGWVYFTRANGGTWVTVDVSGLPAYQPAGASGPRLACGVIRNYRICRGRIRSTATPCN